MKNAEAFLRVVLNKNLDTFKYKVNMPMQEEHNVLIPTLDQVNTLIAASAGAAIHLPILFDSLLGLSCREICAVEWGDIRLSEQTITIHRAVVQDEFGCYVWKLSSQVQLVDGKMTVAAHNFLL